MKSYGKCGWCKPGQMQFLATDYYPMVIVKCSHCHHEGQRADASKHSPEAAEKYAQAHRDIINSFKKGNHAS